VRTISAATAAPIAFHVSVFASSSTAATSPSSQHHRNGTSFQNGDKAAAAGPAKHAASTPGADGDLATVVRLLEVQVDDLRAQLLRKDEIIESLMRAATPSTGAAAAAATATPDVHFGDKSSISCAKSAKEAAAATSANGECVEVSTGDALAAAVANAAVRLILLRGPVQGGGDDGQGTYMLPSRCTIDATRTLDISCVPSSSKDGASGKQRGVRIVGPWKVLNHSRFTVTGVTLEGVPHPRWKRPVISAMNASTVTLRDCCVRGGREGIHLAGKSHGLIWNTTPIMRAVFSSRSSAACKCAGARSPRTSSTSCSWATTPCRRPPRPARRASATRVTTPSTRHPQARRRLQRQ
jgi:hypothetical protein